MPRTNAAPEDSSRFGEIDQEEEMAKLISLFIHDMHTDLEAKESKGSDLNLRSEPTIQKTSNIHVNLPPPSTFVRRRKTAVRTPSAPPMGPSCSPEPTNDSSSDQSDEYDKRLEYLMNPCD